MKTERTERTDVPLVFAVDGSERPLVWLDYALKAARRHLGGSVEIFVVSDSPRDFGCGARTIDARPYVERFGLKATLGKKWRGIPASPIMAMRLFIPFMDELEDYDMAVYMDADTSIEDARFADIFDTDMKGRMVAGVMDMPFNEARRRKYCKGSLAFLDLLAAKGIPKARDARVAGVLEDSRRRLDAGEYVNSGVLLLNMAEICMGGMAREDVAAAVEAAFRSDIGTMIDQGIVNAIWDVKRISSAFNCNSHFHAAGEPCWCIHHVGSAKMVKYPVYSRSQFK